MYVFSQKFLNGTILITTKKRKDERKMENWIPTKTILEEFPFSRATFNKIQSLYQIPYLSLGERSKRFQITTVRYYVNLYEQEQANNERNKKQKRKTVKKR